MTNLEILKPFATPAQARILAAVIAAEGSQAVAARQLGMLGSSVRRHMTKLRQRAALTEPKLHNFEAPPGYRLKGVSTLINSDGEVSQTWVKTAKEQDTPQALLEAFEGALQSKDLRRRTLVPPAKNAAHSKDLLVVYPMGDPHLGLLSWPLETGQDFNLQIAERNLVDAVDHLVGLAPPSETALIINLGDFFHADNMESRTARSGHALDVDSRWAKVLRAGIVAMVRCIDRALEKHLKVRVINEIGNHDDHSALMLSVCLSHHYYQNPRVEIDTSPSPFHWYEFGEVLIGVHHGHTVKADKLPGVMAHDQAQAWGRTKHRYWYTGHVHHETVKEYPGVIVETFRTLAARDAWHHGSGYRAGRSMVCDVVHRSRGRILRHNVGVEELPQTAG